MVGLLRGSCIEIDMSEGRLRSVVSLHAYDEIYEYRQPDDNS